MIAHLVGYLTHKFDDHVIFNVNGVGYEVFLPTRKVLSTTLGSETELYIYTHVKEDSFELFGFPTLEGKTTF